MVLHLNFLYYKFCYDDEDQDVVVDVDVVVDSPTVGGVPLHKFVIQSTG